MKASKVWFSRLKGLVHRRDRRNDFAATYPAAFRMLAQGMETTVVSLQRHLTGDAGDILIILLCAVALVFLLACANIANLQLARAKSAA